MGQHLPKIPTHFLALHGLRESATASAERAEQTWRISLTTAKHGLFLLGFRKTTHKKTMYLFASAVIHVQCTESHRRQPWSPYLFFLGGVLKLGETQCKRRASPRGASPITYISKIDLPPHELPPRLRIFEI